MLNPLGEREGRTCDGGLNARVRLSVGRSVAEFCEQRVDRLVEVAAADGKAFRETVTASPSTKATSSRRLPFRGWRFRGLVTQRRVRGDPRGYDVSQGSRGGTCSRSCDCSGPCPVADAEAGRPAQVAVPREVLEAEDAGAPLPRRAIPRPHRGFFPARPSAAGALDAAPSPFARVNAFVPLGFGPRGCVWCDGEVVGCGGRI